MNISDAPQSLIDKYNLYAADFIEYPKKDYWSTDWSHEQYRDQMLNLLRSREPFVLYLHIPFCRQMCYFCLCHFKITHDYERVQRYMGSLGLEIEMVRKLLWIDGGDWPAIREVHVGGGSPTYMREAEFVVMKAQLSELIRFDDLDEFTIEIDPRAVGRDRLAFYADQGINRISFGVQDFDENVGEAINRVQPAELIENLLMPQIRVRFDSVNFDMLVGLPRQTMETLRETMRRVIGIRPDRISLAFMHYNPRQHKHQGLMGKEGLPDYALRKEMHEMASAMLVEAGYVRAGFEHFALPEDDNAKAVEAGTVQYNSLGATPGRCDWLLGLGVSSYGRVGERCYSQHTYDHEEYAKSVEAGRFPAWRGYVLDDDDVLRRDVIQRLRAVFWAKIDWGYFVHEWKILREMEQDGMVELSDDEVRITELGKNFSIVVCRVFDRHVRDKETGGRPELWAEKFWQGEKVFLE